MKNAPEDEKIAIRSSASFARRSWRTEAATRTSLLGLSSRSEIVSANCFHMRRSSTLSASRYRPSITRRPLQYRNSIVSSSGLYFNRVGRLTDFSKET